MTIGALIAMAAHLEGLGAGEMEMAGLAQKGGAVHIHCRIAAKPSDISAIRVAVGEADAVIGGDLVVTAGAKTLGLMTRGRTRAVVNSHEIPTGDFTRDRGFRLPTDRMTLALRARVGDDALRMLDASRLAERLLGDAIYSNVMMLGAAWQAGLVPLSEEALRRAIEINGASVPGNLEAFGIGRWAVVDPAAALAAAGGAGRRGAGRGRPRRRGRAAGRASGKIPGRAARAALPRPGRGRARDRPRARDGGCERLPQAPELQG